MLFARRTRVPHRACLLQVVVASLILTLVTTSGVSAQDAPSAPQRLSAKQFIERVIQANPRLEIARAQVDAATARERAAGLWDNPALAYDREEVFLSGRGLPENFLSIELPLELSGRRSLRVDSAARGVEAAEAEATATRQALLADAMRIYLTAAAIRDQLVILEESRAALATLRDSIGARTSAGDTSGYDLARIEIELSSLDDLIAETERAQVRTRLKIGALAGRPGEQLDALDALGMEALPAAVDARAAQTARPQVEAAEHRVAQHDLARDAAARGWIPSLTLTGGAKSAALGQDTAWGYVAGVAVGLPVFDHGQADTDLADAELRRAQASLAVIEQQSASDLAAARDLFALTIEQARSFEREQLPRLQLLMSRAELSYKEGERPVFELLDAHRTAREVRARHVTLLLQARLSHVELLEALDHEPGGSQSASFSALSMSSPSPWRLAVPMTTRTTTRTSTVTKRTATTPVTTKSSQHSRSPSGRRRPSCSWSTSRWSLAAPAASQRT